jgi:hypothetical protein
MKRFLMLVGVAVVAAAMYVAAAPGSQQAKGPTAKQFKALKKQVTSLNKKLTALTKSEAATTKLADDAEGFIADCLTSTGGGALGVNQFGTTTGTGFQVGTVGQPASSVRTALDLEQNTTTGAYLQVVDPSCLVSSTAALAQTHSGSSRLPLRLERSH